jgi:hypothetical protein
MAMKIATLKAPWLTPTWGKCYRQSWCAATSGWRELQRAACLSAQVYRRTWAPGEPPGSLMLGWLKAQDIDAATAVYHPDASVVQVDQVHVGTTTARGAEGVRPRWQPCFAMRPHMDEVTHHCPPDPRLEALIGGAARIAPTQAPCRMGHSVRGAFDLRQTAPHRLEFGYVLARPWWGQGLMTEALTEIVHWALRQPSVFRIGAVCDVENTGSARVMAKAGLIQEGRLRRWLVHPNVSDEPRDCFSYARVR